MKAVLHYRASDGFRAMLARHARAAGVEAVVVDEFDDAAFAREIAGAEVLLHVLKPVTAAMIGGAPGLRLIQKLGVGVNTIDLDAARAAGVAVSNMPGTNSQAVAEMALALMLSVLRRLSYLDPLTRRGRGWAPDPDLIDGVGELAGRTVGFVGYGGSASRLGAALEALGATVIYTARSEKPELIGRFAPLARVLAEADIVSLHLPLTPQTQRMIDARALAAMKPGAILINTARGGLVDEPALVSALRSGRLRGAGLDVFDREPVDPDNPLLGLPNVVVAPHQAWLTPETLDRSLAAAFENIRRLQAGEPLLNQVV
ncbi:D-isomer specific 2-hydroxyacid dehydrogenase family protein [Phenylobacterium sp.]|uniref:NAD(P)-dependent oxidoreductase n=1 Tax=Phenylobacterium sp. TaxID=1871053 RepID=UPI0025D75846|nr:2-hydroxyacid dehydrogenase [Phenylobacterium sp.]MBX3484867.1 2-hydroxyacid dehydrogenase [Phenylobacterium sp.]MCW5761579.1 2-hydroxyacid dehydrogenase [Phenylobacterium sp.]